MFALLAQIASLFSRTFKRSARRDDVAHNLMERAEASAGLDPRQARELRSAALAYLSVVR